LEQILNIPGAIARRLRDSLLRLRGVKIGRRGWLQPIEVPRRPHDIALGDDVSLDRGVVLLVSAEGPPETRLRIGDRTYINRASIVDAAQDLRIGSDCMIGPFCYLTDHDHGSSPDFPPGAQLLISKPTHIGNRVWLGAGVKILKGVIVGDGAVVGAGAVVTRDVPAGARVAGVPARIVGDHETR
jgi:maltose O-acetyltransferase